MLCLKNDRLIKLFLNNKLIHNWLTRHCGSEFSLSDLLSEIGKSSILCDSIEQAGDKICNIWIPETHCRIVYMLKVLHLHIFSNCQPHGNWNNKINYFFIPFHKFPYLSSISYCLDLCSCIFLYSFFSRTEQNIDQWSIGQLKTNLYWLINETIYK